ncbi:hypothetical protein [Burkholderia stagnalis]|uniref:hypothetical protein n=1 Tax=Burkholderia stagnalis TaxID=1503054 RepID=UPI000F812E9E|nr:hypothetical protein [Burkholderia stagnalis]
MADDQIDVKVRADTKQATDAEVTLADVTEETSSRMRAALEALRVRSERVSERVSENFREMAHHARESASEMQEHLERIEGRLNAFSKFATTIGEVAIAGAVGDWAIEQVKSIGEYGEALEHASQETGVAIGELQKLDYVGRATGLTADEMTRSMGLLSRRLAEAQGGAKQAAEALALVGIRADEIKGMSLDEAMRRVAEAFKAHADGANKAALAMELFGRGGLQMVPLLDRGAEGFDELSKHAQEAGAVIDTETVEAMARLGQHINILEADASAASMTFKGQLAVAFDAVVQSLDDVIKNGTGAKEVMNAFGEGIKGVVTIVIGAVTALNQFTDLLNGIALAANDFGKGNFSAAARDVADGWNKARSEGEGFLKTYDRIWHAEHKAAGEHEGGGHRPDFGVVHRGGGSSSARGEAAVAAAEAASKLAYLKEILQEEARANQDAYRAGAIDLRQYYEQREAIERRGLQGEIVAKQAERATLEAIKPKDANEALQLKAKMITVNGQLAVLDQKLADSSIRNAREYTLALRDQNDQLQRIAVQKGVNVGQQTIAQEKAILDERVALGQLSVRQQLQSETDLENERFALVRDELSREIELAHNKPVELARINASIEEAEAEHQTKLTELAAKGVQDQMKYQVEGTQAVDASISTMFEHIAEGHESLHKIFMDFFNDLDRQISRIMAKGLTENLFGGGTEGGGWLQSLMSRIFGTTGVNTTPGAGSVTGSGAAALGASGVFKGLGGAGGAPLTGITSNSMTVATMQTGAANIPIATVATMTVANLIAPGGGSGGGGFGDMLGGLFGGGTNSYGFSLAGTGIPGVTAATTSGAGMALPAGLGGIGAGIPMYAQGTGYVPETQLAMVHKGEAIIPARYNRASSGSVVVTNHFQLGQATDLRTQTQIATLAASSLGRAARRNG